MFHEIIHDDLRPQIFSDDVYNHIHKNIGIVETLNTGINHDGRSTTQAISVLGVTTGRW